MHIVICTYWSAHIEPKKGVSGICSLKPHFFNFKVTFFEKSFQYECYVSRNEEIIKNSEDPLGFNVFTTLSPNLTKTDQIPAENKLSKDQNLS